MFSIGQKSEENKNGKSTLGQNTSKIDIQADKRLEEFGMKQTEQKRDRETHNVYLRKQKRDEVIKRRRHIDNDPNSQEGQQSPNSGINYTVLPNGMQVNQITIQDALNYQKQSGMECQAFITNIACKMRFSVNDFSQLNQLIYSEDVLTKMFACVGFRKLLSIEMGSGKEQPPIQETIDAGLVSVFIQFLHHHIPKFQFEAAWCLTNIASGSTEHVNNLLEKGVLSHFIQILDSPHVEVVEQVIWGLGNIAGDCTAARDTVLSSGILEKLAHILDQAPMGSSFLRNGSWTLSNLCRGRPNPPYETVRRAVPTLNKVIIENDNTEIITDILWAISYLSDGAKDCMTDFMMDQRLVKKLISLLTHEDVAIVVPSIRTIGNIVTGDNEQTQVAIDAGLVPQLDRIIGHQRKQVRKEVCWVLSNVTAGSIEQIQCCIDSGIIDKLIRILVKDELPVKNEAVWALSNCTASASPEQFEVLVDKGIIESLGSVLKGKDVRMLAVALEGLENILRCGSKFHRDANNENIFTMVMEQEGLLDDLEQLQQHQNHTIYEKALNIIEVHFPQEEDDDLIETITNTMNNTNAANATGNGPAPANGNSTGLFDL